MTAHRHAEKMRLYADDAAETDTPWERWQYFGFSEEWLDLFTHPAWLTETEYRRKPKPMECWVIVVADEVASLHYSEESAISMSSMYEGSRVANMREVFHMREVTE